jgi:hypothetical protein
MIGTLQFLQRAFAYLEAEITHRTKSLPSDAYQ